MAITASMVKDLREKTGAGLMDCKKALTANDGDMDKAVDWLREKGIAKANKKVDRIAAEGLCDVVVDGDKAVIFELNSETDFVAKNDQFLTLLKEIGSVLINSNVENVEEILALPMADGTVASTLTAATSKIGEKITLRRVKLFSKEAGQVFGAYKHNGGKIAVVVTLDGADEQTAKEIAMHVAAINPKYLDSSEVSPEVVEQEKAMLTKEALNEGKPANIVEKMVVGRLNKYLKEICLVNQPCVVNGDLTVEKYVKQKGGSVKGFTRFEVGEGIEKRVDDFASEVMAQVNK